MISDLLSSFNIDGIPFGKRIVTSQNALKNLKCGKNKLRDKIFNFNLKGNLFQIYPFLKVILTIQI